MSYRAGRWRETKQTDHANLPGLPVRKSKESTDGAMPCVMRLGFAASIGALNAAFFR
jgi:hypothetical protein